MTKSRMAKLLDRIAGKDEESQEDTQKEEKMTKSSKFDLDLAKLKGETTTTPPVTKEEQAEPHRPFDTLKSKETPMDRLVPPPKPEIEVPDETWICFIENGQVESRQLEHCTAEEFGKWLCWVYPPATEFLKKNMHLYEKFENREQEFKNIVKFLTMLPKHFEKGSHKSDIETQQKEEKGETK